MPSEFLAPTVVVCSALAFLAGAFCVGIVKDALHARREREWAAKEAAYLKPDSRFAVQAFRAEDR